jgi:hypothetical protein
MTSAPDSSTTAIDLELFRLPENQGTRASSVTREEAGECVSVVPSSEKMQGEFLAGPIKLDWLAQAAKLPGAALAVAILVRHLHTMRGREWVVLSNFQVARFGISPSGKRRAISALVAEGLIRIDQRPGCAPRVIPVGDR